jgi:GNAT superfamily N-acetyltransferase
MSPHLPIGHTMVIRAATTSDIADLVPLMEAQIAEHPFGVLFKGAAGSLEAFLVRVMELGVVIVVTDRILGRPGDKPRIFGLLAVVALPHHLSGEPYAHEVAFYVEPALRGTNAGIELIRAVEAWACKKTLHVLKMVAPVGGRLEPFYKRQGFEAVETSFIKRL